MSVVDNQTVESTEASTTPKELSVEDSLQSEESEDSTTASTTRTAESTTSVAGEEIDMKRSAGNAAREWFQKLDTAERVHALGFVDGPFLLALLSLAPWSTPAASGLETPAEGANGRYWY